MNFETSAWVSSMRDQGSFVFGAETLAQAQELVVLGSPLAHPSQCPSGGRNRQLIDAATRKFWRAFHSVKAQLRTQGCSEA